MNLHLSLRKAGVPLVKTVLCIFSSGILNPLCAQEGPRQIEIVHADYVEFSKSMGAGVKRLIGHVVFRQGNAEMYCDSAYHYSDENRVDAYSHIHIKQGDTLDLYGDYMKYLGNLKLAQVRRNVRLIDRENRLRTEYLDFNLAESYGYFFNGGDLDNGENRMKSRIGYYYSRLKLFHFKDHVEIYNPKYTIFSDTVKYNTVSQTAWFFGPTHILSKENTIYCENGWYDTKLNIAQFNQNSRLYNKGQILTGDSLHYERDIGFGEAFKHVELFDSSENVLLKGSYGWYYEKPERAMITGKAEMLKMNNSDTLYIHADTLRSVTDSLQKKVMLAYYHVKFFKSDLSSKCDSLRYSESDSTIRLFGEPVLWSDVNQITAEHIDIYTKNRKIDRLDMLSSAMIIEQVDTQRFNQVKGKKMVGYFSDGLLSRIKVNGNGQTIYFPKDGNEIIGMNKADATNLIIYLKEKKMSRIVWLVKPSGTLFPPEKINPQEMVLKGFKWLDDYRPLTKEDIFVWRMVK
jgi:lipopolysaccharide export system protein LptA